MLWREWASHSHFGLPESLPITTSRHFEVVGLFELWYPISNCRGPNQQKRRPLYFELAQIWLSAIVPEKSSDEIADRRTSLGISTA
jgi:hypothetical protein